MGVFGPFKDASNSHAPAIFVGGWDGFLGLGRAVVLTWTRKPIRSWPASVSKMVGVGGFGGLTTEPEDMGQEPWGIAMVVSVVTWTRKPRFLATRGCVGIWEMLGSVDGTPPLLAGAKRARERFEGGACGRRILFECGPVQPSPLHVYDQLGSWKGPG